MKGERIFIIKIVYNFIGWRGEKPEMFPKETEE